MLDDGTMSSAPVSVDEKREALERVLASRTFSRSEQLRSLLRSICEAEFEGRAHELNEYALGVSALGRPPDYSPGEDSCVRSRAYELRNKLKSYYQQEAPEDPLEIEIQKGAYIPRFLRRQTEQAQTGAPELVQPGSELAGAEQPRGATGSAERRYVSRLIAAVVVLALMVVALSLYILHSSRKRTGQVATSQQVLSPEMAALWKPFVSDGSPLLVSFDVRPFFYAPSTGLIVRDYQVNRTEDVPWSRPLSQFQERMGTHDLRETLDYADSGAVHAIFLLERLLAPQGQEIELKRSRSLGWDDIWNANLVFIGKPHLNPSIQYVLKSGDLVDDGVGVIRNLHPQPGERSEYRSAETHGAGEKYALITVLPGPQPGHHIMILSGSGSELMWALAECVTNPDHVREIVSHLKTRSGELPQAFQVLIQATFESNVPIRIRYVTHRVSQSS